MDIYGQLRKLAKDSYYQSLYSLGKELHNIHIFDNKRDFTDIQMAFLRYLNFYASIYLDIVLGDIDEIVLDNEVYEDSYMFWKSKKDKTKYKDEGKAKPSNYMETSRWIFKNKK